MSVREIQTVQSKNKWETWKDTSQKWPINLLRHNLICNQEHSTHTHRHTPPQVPTDEVTGQHAQFPLVPEERSLKECVHSRRPAKNIIPATQHQAETCPSNPKEQMVARSPGRRPQKGAAAAADATPTPLIRPWHHQTLPWFLVLIGEKRHNWTALINWDTTAEREPERGSALGVYKHT